MSLFRPRSEKRSANWDVLREFGTGGTYVSGMTRALQLGPVYAATSYIADAFSMLPLAAYSDRGGGRRKLNPQPDLITSPHVNELFTRVEWLHQGITSWLLRGNAYGVITALDDAGRPSKIAWLNPDSVRVDERGTTPDYYYGGNDKPLDKSTLVHIPWYPAPGSVVGLSPISLFKRQIEMGSSAVDYGHNWFTAGGVPSGHLMYGAGPLDTEQSAVVKARFKEAVRGNDFFVSGNDWSWTSLAVKPAEAEFLQTIKATANVIASIYRIPPEEIGGEATNSLTYSTVELNQINFQTRTLAPIFTRWEHHLNRLLPKQQYVKFNPDSVVRTDLKSRMEAHALALANAIETNPEARALEERPPLTPDEIAQWTEMYKKTAAAPAAAPTNEGGA